MPRPERLMNKRGGRVAKLGYFEHPGSVFRAVFMRAGAASGRIEETSYLERYVCSAAKYAPLNRVCGATHISN